MEFNLLPETFVRLFDPVYLILESRYFSSNRFQLFNVSRSSAKIQLLRIFVISAIIRIKKQKRDPYPRRSIGRNRFRLTFLPFNSRVREEN